jgi:hypothetical protein
MRSWNGRAPEGAHYQRGNFATRVMRPAADGIYPARTGARARPARPVLVDTAVYGPKPERGRPQVVEGACAWPGRPVYWPWPRAEKDQEFVPPRGRGRPDWGSWAIAERPHLASRLPIMEGLTPRGPADERGSAAYRQSVGKNDKPVCSACLGAGGEWIELNGRKGQERKWVPCRPCNGTGRA